MKIYGVLPINRENQDSSWKEYLVVSCNPETLEFEEIGNYYYPSAARSLASDMNCQEWARQASTT